VQELLPVIHEVCDMNRLLCDKFISRIEELSKTFDSNDTVTDSFGTYSKIYVLENIVLETRNLIAYGEYKIALENMLANLCEISFVLDEKTIALARQAFGNESEESKIYLENLTR
jgi:hypothetical protein